LKEKLKSGKELAETASDKLLVAKSAVLIAKLDQKYLNALDEARENYALAI